MPFWDGECWHVWFPTEVGLIEGKVVDTLEGDYVARTPAHEHDLYIPFVHTMWQRASWPDVCPLISAICDDFHNMGTSVAKLRHFFDYRSALPAGSARRFACTELEYLVILCRAVFDLLQEMISVIWKERVQLHDSAAEARRRSAALPETFSKIVLRDKQSLKTAEEIEKQYGLPKPLAETYAQVGPFFAELRNARDDVVHGGGDFNGVFDTERGFCVDPKQTPFASFKGWRLEHYYNDNITSALPWIANAIFTTIGACNSLTSTLASIIQLPPEIAPGHQVFVRGPHNAALISLLQVQTGASPWW